MANERDYESDRVRTIIDLNGCSFKKKKKKKLGRTKCASGPWWSRTKRATGQRFSGTFFLFFLIIIIIIIVDCVRDGNDNKRG